MGSKPGDTLRPPSKQWVVGSNPTRDASPGTNPRLTSPPAAIIYLRNGGDVFSLQRILGHSTPDVVRSYVNMSDVDVKACHRRCSPGRTTWT